MTDNSLDWDWDSFKVDAPPPSLLDPYGELQPVAVDNSLTSLLFTASSTGAPVEPVEPVEPAPRIMPEHFAPETSVDLQGALFETV